MVGSRWQAQDGVKAQVTCDVYATHWESTRSTRMWRARILNEVRCNEGTEACDNAKTCEKGMGCKVGMERL